MFQQEFWTGLVLAGAVVAALRTIWVLWVRPILDGVKGLVATARDSAALLREMRDFFHDQLPSLIIRFDVIERAYAKHIEDESMARRGVQDEHLPVGDPAPE